MTAVEVEDVAGDRIKLVEVDGYRVCNFDREPDHEGEIIREIKSFNCKDDDVFILAPMKSGTHWVWEIASMLMASRAETIPESKCKHMLEHQALTYFESIDSPRILNSHLDIAHLPTQLFEKRIKIVHVLRNPKDMLVSFYHHVTGIHCYDYAGKWENFLKLFLNDELEYGSWFNYVREWEQFINENMSYPVHVMFYEDLQKNSMLEIQRLGEFLGLQSRDELVAAISENCSFNKMYTNKMYPDEIRKQVFKGDFTMYRKGIVGDWKDWFTAAQNETFDQHYNEKMLGSSLKFDFTLA